MTARFLATIASEMQALAAQVEGHLEPPRLRWKYAWMKPVFGWKVAKWGQMWFPEVKSSLIRHWDKAMYRLEAGRAITALRNQRGPGG